MEARAILPGHRSPAERAGRRARHAATAVAGRTREEVSAHPRAVAAGAVVLGAGAAALVLARRSRGDGRVSTGPPNQGATGDVPAA